MSSITARERPGVYSIYDASSVYSAGTQSRTIAVAAAAADGEAGVVRRFTGYEASLSFFGQAEDGRPMSELIRLLFLNGATTVVAVATAVGGQEEDYDRAFELIAGEDDVRIVVCGSTNAEVHAALKESVQAACAEQRDRIAVVGSDANDVNTLVEKAAALNDERMVLAAPNALDSGGNELGGIYTAAAMAAVIAAEQDPAVPLGGAEIKGLGGVAVKYGEGDIDLLIRGGVTPVESVSGAVTVVRGVTTRTKTAGSADNTWRELTTVLIVDNVIPTIRNGLRAKFARAKNTAQTRGAIRSQVIMELEKKLTAEIIDGYGDVSVRQSDDDPTVCVVDFEFDVAHGLNQIHLYAHITV